MALCNRCGKKYSRWGSNDVLQNLCNDCTNADAAAELRDSFPCSIPDRAITSYERFAVGATTGGAFRGLLRQARVKLVDGELHIKAKTDPVAGGGVVTVAKIPVKAISHVRRVAMPMGSQVKASFGRAAIVGGVFAVTLLIIVGAKGAGDAAPLAAILGFALGFAFSLVPNLSKLRSDLTEFQFVLGDSEALPIALTSEQQAGAEKVLATASLKITDAEANAEAGQPQLPKRRLIKGRAVEATCNWCSQKLHGTSTDFQGWQEAWRASNLTPQDIIGYICPACGVTSHSTCKQSGIGHSMWSGFKSSICGKCNARVPEPVIVLPKSKATEAGVNTESQV